MVNLEALSPCTDILPLTVGAVKLTEIVLPEGKVWSVSPCPVRVGKSKESTTRKTLWIGRDHGLQIGGQRPKAGSITDQSDAWACVRISGSGTDDVLARLCPVDLPKMAQGEVARTLMNHMSAIILSTRDGYEIFVFRAFGRSLVQELKEAAKAVEGRNQLSL